MTLLVSPEIGVPLSPHVPYTDLRERAEAACNTALELEAHGLDLTPNDEDKVVAATLTAAYAENPDNKLLLESENPDPRIRLRAIELLGKISDVSLFAEKTEVTVTHQTTDELRAILRQKLEKIVRPSEEVEEAVFSEETEDLEGECTDLAQKLDDE